MYCPQCKCDYVGWTDKCPVDGTILVGTSPLPAKPTHASLPYESIVDMIRDNGGSLEIDLHTAEVGRERKMGFPFRGYGFAWARKIIGESDGVAVDLRISEIGKDREYSFPYQGYGFAWEKQMRGWLGGNEINLTATKVTREKRLLFPYRGHGYSWAEELSGQCGKSIRASLKTTEIGRDRNWFLFYFGFGYAWIDRATLVLTLTE